MTSDDWQALGAVGTCAAVVVALIALAWEHVNRWRDERDKDAAQARLIIDTSDGFVSGNILKLRITNFSDKPAIDLRLWKVTWSGAPEGSIWQTPGTMMGARKAISVLGAGETFETYVEWVDRQGQRQEIGVNGTYSLTYRFLDHSGLAWSRAGQEQPERVREKN